MCDDCCDCFYLARLVLPGPREGAEGGGGVVVAVELGEVRQVATKTVLTPHHHRLSLTVVHLSL